MPGIRRRSSTLSALAPTAAQAIAPAHVPFGGFGIASWVPCDGAQNEADAIHLCVHDPPGPAGPCGNDILFLGKYGNLFSRSCLHSPSGCGSIIPHLMEKTTMSTEPHRSIFIPPWLKRDAAKPAAAANAGKTTPAKTKKHARRRRDAQGVVRRVEDRSLRRAREVARCCRRQEDQACAKERVAMGTQQRRTQEGSRASEKGLTRGEWEAGRAFVLFAIVRTLPPRAPLAPPVGDLSARR
jgi:hypothetical protein